MQNWRKNLFVILAILVGVAILGTVLPTQTPDTNKNPDKHQVAQKKKDVSPRDLAFYVGRKIVDGVRNPASVRFSFAAAMPDGTLCYDLRSQNGFGGMSEGMVVETKKHGYLYQQDTGGSPGFRAAWNAHCANKQPAVSVVGQLNEYARKRGSE
jgi:hypothetical protein